MRRCVKSSVMLAHEFGTRQYRDGFIYHLRHVSLTRVKGGDKSVSTEFGTVAPMVTEGSRQSLAPKITTRVQLFAGFGYARARPVGV